jgi:hypothetical protein
MSFASWAPNTYYLIGNIVNNGSANYQCVKVNLSSASNKPPNVTYWTPYGSGGDTNYSAGVGIQFQTPVGGATPIATSLVAGSNMSFQSNGNAITLNVAGGSGNVTNPLSSFLDCATFGLSNAGYLQAPTITGTYDNTTSNFPITINSDIITFSNPLGGLDRTTLSNIGTAAISNITTLQNVAGQGGASNYINYTSGINFGSFSNSILGCSNIQTSNINGSAYPPAATILPSGIFTCSAQSIQTIPITGLTSAGVVNLTYIERIPQTPAIVLTAYSPTANQLDVGISGVASTDDKIIWSVASL